MYGRCLFPYGRPTAGGAPFFVSTCIVWQILVCLSVASACSTPKPSRPVIVQPMSPASPPPPSSSSAAQQPDLPADAQVRLEPQLGTISHLQAQNLSASLERDAVFRSLQTTGRFADIALAFLSAHRSLFRLQDPRNEFTISSVQNDNQGLKHIHLQQTFRGLPVYTGDLIVHLDRDNHVYLVQGKYIPTPQHLSTTPQLTRDTAEQKAAEYVGTSSGCRNCRSELLIFALGDKGPRLAYRVNVKVSVMEGWEVFVDAEQGGLLEKIPTTLNLQLQR
ncbi:MAG: hypothetical protein AB7G75_01970 [Candidatus Binatia bacterium]